jgi:choline kinase/phosphoglycolate phosphatase-like HAD superfamily hydrolase/phosphatidylglycerophosphate synthase
MKEVDPAMQPARLVVLASGMGSRLRSKTSPKPLVELGGISLIERVLAGARQAGFDEVVVVTGHRADQIDRHMLEVSRRRGIAVTVVRNERYREGNGLSALAARDGVGHEPFALVMADHVFSPSLLQRLKQSSVEPGEVLVAVDTRLGQAAGVDPRDAMKVRVADGHIRAIGKQLALYDAFDVGAFVCGPALFDAVEMAVAAGDSSLAGAIQVLADAGVARALPIGDEAWWFDVDTPRDHRNGSRHLLLVTGKSLDGAIAARLNRTLSQRVVTPALLALFRRITPNQVTLIAFAVAVAAATAFAVGAPIAAALLVVLASVLDGSDGEVARLTHRSSPYGAFLDAVVDRAADGILFTGAAIYLATDARLGDLLGGAQVHLVLAVTGAALVGHLLVSYTTAKAAIDLGHRYRGTLLGGGRGRDLRLFLVTLGALAAAVEPLALLVALAAVALLSAWIVVVRLHRSWWAAGPGSHYVGVRAVALDFDGTVADSMGFLTDLAVGLLVAELGFERTEATRQYLTTAGSDFATQLDEIAPGQPRLAEVAGRFEAAKAQWMGCCEMFSDVIPAVERLAAAGVPVLLCSSTRAPIVRLFCERYGLLQRFASVDGWGPGHTKFEQLVTGVAAAGFAGHEVIFVGDSRRDAAVAGAAGTRFVGLVRAGHPDALAGSGAKVVASLSELAADLVQAVHSPVTLRARECDPVLTPPVEPGLSAFNREAPEMGVLVGPHEPAHPGDHPDGGDRAVVDLDVPIDLGAGTERPGDGGAHHGIVGEHDGHAAVD